MTSYKVEISDAAQKDLEDIIDYLATLQEDIAEKYYNIIEEKIKSLSSLARRCPYARDLRLKSQGYRDLIVHNYLVFYQIVRDDIVLVRRVIYSKRDYGAIL